MIPADPADAPFPSSPVATPPPQKLLTFSSGGWVILLSVFFTFVAAGIVLIPIYQTGFRSAVGDGKNVDSYGFDLTHLAIPKSQLIASSRPKDGIPAIPPSLIETMTIRQVDIMNKNDPDHRHFLVKSDRVICVTIGKESRAYPTRVLNFHEIANDVVGGMPIAVTWSALCDAAVVFDRRIDGESAPPVEFGNSGLLVNSNLVMFDRRSNTIKESLWLQLSFKGISGPFAEKPLKQVQFALTTWEDWSTKHPDTTVLLGYRTHKEEYIGDPYGNYSTVEEVKFPVEPLWSSLQISRKTRIVVNSPDGVHWTAAPATAVSSPVVAPALQDFAYLFAWYAQHPKDTNYTAFADKK